MRAARGLLHGLMLLAGSTVAAHGGDAVGAAPPRDVDYPGTLTLRVDASDVDRRIVRVAETIPVQSAGTLTLLYPRWLPGNHSTTGPVEMLAGLQVRTAAGERVEWRRDPQSAHAFHVEVPAATTELHLQFEFITPVASEQGRQVMTQDLLGLQWEKALLYPAGHYASRITVAPSLTLPGGWSHATALGPGERVGDTVRFTPVTLERLVDSPVFAGLHYRREVLDPHPRAPVQLHVFADRPGELAATPAQLALHRRMVGEALALFGGTRHYGRYDFLLAISNQFAAIGLEHHESSENAVAPGYFTDWAGAAPSRDLLPHEFVHSWNGKFRRPADLWTPSYDVPMQSSLLWVYEGLTEYLGMVLATRSGLWSPAYLRETLALHAATFDHGRAGRAWRNLQDTTRQPVIQYRGLQSYPSWQRGKDYYTEGALLWLDVDTRIRELTRDRRTLDDFVRRFFGVEDGRVAPLTYTFEEVVATLHELAPFDWARYLRARLDGHGPAPPHDGLERGGWRVAYSDTPGEALRAIDAAAELDGFLFSLGLSLDKAGRVMEVFWDSPAFAAGIAPRSVVVAVDGRAYTAALLREAVTAAKSAPTRRIALLVRRGDTYETVTLDYHGGLRYPRLERVPARDDRLGAIIAPRTRSATTGNSVRGS
jgi:predicted metalloprotease with PDZ domain